MKKKGTLFEPWYFQENGELKIVRYVTGEDVREIEGKLYLYLGEIPLYIPVKEVKDKEKNHERKNH